MSKTTRKELATAILNMTYTELLAFTGALATMKPTRLVTREEFAALLHEWAETQR